ncbi:MAG TPA: N-methyl-L-tryptophan oxidase [Thermoanaerobaculia bacterium]|nr:N-methyl-L-tryptophan oxidase [Thermoanaerobaculia bacterium]
MRRDWDVIVLGLGGIGSGGLYWLARELHGDVLGIEQFAPGHDRGGSQDHHRIIRYSYHRPCYVSLARGAYEAWGAVAADSGETLVVPVGGLDLFPPGGTIPLDDYTSSLDAEAIAYEILDASQVRERWPAFRLDAGTVGLYQRDGGYVRAAAGNAAHLALAREHGAQLATGAPVEGLEARGGEVTVEAGGVRYRCGRVVVCGGAWSNDLLAPLGWRLPLTVTQEQVTYFQPEQPELLAESRFPVWIWMDDPCFYGFPMLEGEGVKVAQDVGGREVTARTRTFEPDPEALGRVTGFLERFLPEALGPVRRVKTCLYTLTPDRDFVIDRVPEHPECMVAIGAGHAYKFASVIGRVLARLALGQEPGFDLEPFRIDRPILLEKDPPKQFMV